MLGPFDLTVPPIVLLTAAATLPFTLAILPLTDPSALSSWQTIRHAWFKHFWWWFGPGSKPLFAPTVRPILEQAYGVVLDIGPASGIWMHEFGLAVKASPGRITKIYGVEPNVLFHPQLRAKAKANGLEGIYEPVGVYAEDLETTGIMKGTVDTVITVHVLCSVGSAAQTIVKTLYEYLKPGGQWLVYEHVVSKNTPVKHWQGINNTVWGHLLDGCNLVRDTEKILKNAVEWDSAEIQYDPNEGYFETLPHTMGRLIKKRSDVESTDCV